MRKTLISAVMGLAITSAVSSAKAQVNLSEYADPDGFLDIQTLTCAQLAGTWQDQADLLASWYSGGLSRPLMWFSKACGKEWASRCSNSADACFLSMRSRSRLMPYAGAETCGNERGVML